MEDIIMGWDDLTTTVKGEICEYHLTIKMLEKGWEVLKPISLVNYDLAFIYNDTTYKVQCKHGKLKDGVIYAHIHSTNVNTKGKTTIIYGDDISYFGIYCSNINKCYLIPRNICANHTLNLRLTPPKNNQNKGVILAEQYEI